MRQDLHLTPHERRPVSRWLLVLTVAALLGIYGCAHVPGGRKGRQPPVMHPRLQKAAELFESGDYHGALIECVEVSQHYPQTPGLVPFRERVLATVMEAQAREAALRSAGSQAHMSIEALQAAAVPLTYGLRTPSQALPEDHLSPESPMRKVLDTPISLSLKSANLANFIEALSVDENINIIADHGLGKDKRMDVEVEQAPLREVLAYAARNLGVQCYLGDHIIWVTAPADRAAPMDTRIYRLRQGIQMHADAWGGKPKDDENVIGRLSHRATVLSEGKTYLEEVIEKMVPAHEGAVMHFDRTTHTLFVRNTRENLETIDRIVKALDINPPQVLIEARFIEITVGDLRETGIEWILNSPLVLHRQGVLDGGEWVREDSLRTRGLSEDTLRTRGVTERDDVFIPRQPDGRRIFSYDTYETPEGIPTHPLGPQGIFAAIGTPPLANQGLMLAIEGVLTQPLFDAVLHALEISGRGRTLSMPRVTTLNNNPAKLRSGEDLRYFEEFQAQAFNLVDANNQRYTITVLIPRGKPVVEELGITLVAVPSVGADMQSISLMLNPTISSLEGFVNYQEGQTWENRPLDIIRQVVAKLPIFGRREVATKLIVQSGETVVMGGLIDTVTQETVQKVPILGDIPFVGHLFRRTGVTEQRRNLLIFVTATVISDRGESLVRMP